MNEIVRVFFKWKIYYSTNDFVNFKKLPENFGPKIGLARNHIEILPTPIDSLKVVKITNNNSRIMKLNDNKKIKIKQKQVLIYISSKYYYSEHIKPEFWANNGQNRRFSWKVAAELPVSAITVTLIDFICSTDNSGAIHMHFKVISYHMLLFLDL